MKCQRLAVVAAGLMLLGACSGTEESKRNLDGYLPEEVYPEWKQEFDYAMQFGNELEREILQDYIITAAEFEEMTGGSSSVRPTGVLS